jgi:antitoxin component of RelBE/YafQ-DinJ toxin-antitoxin module
MIGRMAKEKFTTTIDPVVLKVARALSKETGVPLSTVVERLLAQWVTTGKLPLRVNVGKRE